MERYQFNTLEEYKQVYRTPKDRVSQPNINPFTNQLTLDSRMMKVRDLLIKNQIDSVIDLGCGDGVLCFALERDGIHADGVEIDPGVVAVNKEYADKIFSKCKFFHSAVEEFKPSKQYQCAILMDVLEHSMYPDIMLWHAEDCVEKNGYVIITTPDKYGAFGSSDENPQHINLYTTDALKELIGIERIIYFEVINDIMILMYRNKICLD